LSLIEGKIWTNLIYSVTFQSASSWLPLNIIKRYCHQRCRHSWPNLAINLVHMFSVNKVSYLICMFSTQSELATCVVQKSKAKPKCHNYFNRSYMWSASIIQSELNMRVLFINVKENLTNRADMLTFLWNFEVDHKYGRLK
jgi:hypothetical protein